MAPPLVEHELQGHGRVAVCDSCCGATASSYILERTMGTA
eukprot:CAMPEP_0206269220 /NCGR_PEP_ID=MMETSP0047_2-20121206/32161_1 /ASSEMBLY_ACC=CAM_ASM_000192 /TAXON_ID=195065 /ORGANISM="Chroomonas mesostigmatica_cf, Strain CCMP1168" /LENGTH=39 /DNA_ID= /DNA_START= /DNA_END= /DNA_ORIENTATION=